MEMTGLLIILVIAYLIVGIGVYAVMDTTSFASRLESVLMVFSYGFINDHLFAFVVVFWPLWIIIDRKKG
jgi:uncharacterized membrane protein